jgi:hypothetical protein
MPISLLFWILMILWFIFGVMGSWPGRQWVGPYGPLGNTIFLFVLFLILGWKAFGEPLHG